MVSVELEKPPAFNPPPRAARPVQQPRVARKALLAMQRVMMQSRTAHQILRSM
jgi:hypothetical protein